MKSGNLNFLEPSGPLQACNMTALPLAYKRPYVSFRGALEINFVHKYLSEQRKSSLNFYR